MQHRILIVDDHPIVPHGLAALIGQGLTTQQIAGRFQRSPKTIETHRRNIRRKLNLQNSVELSRRAFDWVRETH